MTDTEECAICLDDIDENIYATACEHKFHSHCLYNWTSEPGENAKLCPTCRNPLDIAKIKIVVESNGVKTTYTLKDFLEEDGVSLHGEKDESILFDLSKGNWAKLLSCLVGLNRCRFQGKNHISEMINIEGKHLLFITSWVECKFIPQQSGYGGASKLKLIINDETTIKNLLYLEKVFGGDILRVLTKPDSKELQYMFINCGLQRLRNCDIFRMKDNELDYDQSTGIPEKFKGRVGMNIRSFTCDMRKLKGLPPIKGYEEMQTFVKCETIQLLIDVNDVEKRKKKMKEHGEIIKNFLSP
jgi:hypothetical protein